QTYTVWIVNHTRSDPPLDTAVGLVTFVATEATSLLNGILPVNLPAGFTLDRVAVTTGSIWGVEPLAAGLVNVFQKIFFRALAQLERPQLMHQYGLILENLDGFDDPTNKFVMRGVPHTLGLQVSLAQDPTQQPNPPAEMTGWSGDGAPGTGSLREFAIGAVTQHFTKSLNRVQGTDFRLPQQRERAALEAFQLSLR